MEINPVLWMVIPCYNEEEVLPVTAPLFLKELKELQKKEKLVILVEFYLLMMVRRIRHGI